MCCVSSYWYSSVTVAAVCVFAWLAVRVFV
eukprot:COSAG04_NODE_23166_length_343_cov_0.487705_1_plen_29_part_10